MFCFVLFFFNFCFSKFLFCFLIFCFSKRCFFCFLISVFQRLCFAFHFLISVFQNYCFLIWFYYFCFLELCLFLKFFFFAFRCLVSVLKWDNWTNNWALCNVWSAVRKIYQNASISVSKYHILPYKGRFCHCTGKYGLEKNQFLAYLVQLHWDIPSIVVLLSFV